MTAINEIWKAIIENPIALVVFLICATVVVFIFRTQLSPFVIAVFKIFTGKHFGKTYSEEKAKKSVAEQPLINAPKGVDISYQTHSYGIHRGWGQNEEDVFLQLDSLISECRMKRWKCAFDFSEATVMNRQTHDGILKAIRKALDENNVGITVVFPKNIEEIGGSEESKERFFRKCFDTLSSACKSSVTVNVIKNTRAETRMITNINIDYLTPADSSGRKS